MATENIPSRLHCVAEGNVLAGANEILDDDKGKKQTVINQENDQRLETLETAVGTGGSVDSRIESAKTEIVGGASSDCNTLGKAEALISTNANDIAALQEAYAALTQNDVVVVEPSDTWPVPTPEQNIIYRVVDRTNTPPQYYADYMWNGTAMVEMAQYNNAIDAVPTAGSHNLVESGGVQNELALGAVYDVSTHNSNATFASLEALLSNANLDTLIPTSVRKGGMSIKFVQSSDNKYVQYRLMAQAFSTTESDWQGVDEEPTAGSHNLVESGGVVNKIGFEITGLNIEGLQTSAHGCSFNINVKAGVIYKVKRIGGSYVSIFTGDGASDMTYVSDSIKSFIPLNNGRLLGYLESYDDNPQIFIAYQDNLKVNIDEINSTLNTTNNNIKELDIKTIITMNAVQSSGSWKYDFKVQQGKKYYVKHISGQNGNFFTGDGSDQIQLVTDKWVLYTAGNTANPYTYGVWSTMPVVEIVLESSELFKELSNIENEIQNSKIKYTTLICKRDGDATNNDATHFYGLQAITAALNSITDASYSNRYIIKIVGHFLFTDPNDITLNFSGDGYAPIISKSWVSIEGIDKKQSSIEVRFDANTTFPSGLSYNNYQPVYVDWLMGDFEIRNLTIIGENTRYVFHIETNSPAAPGVKLTVDGCDLINMGNSVGGIGNIFGTGGGIQFDWVIKNCKTLAKNSNVLNIAYHSYIGTVDNDTALKSTIIFDSCDFNADVFNWDLYQYNRKDTFVFKNTNLNRNAKGYFEPKSSNRPKLGYVQEVITDFPSIPFQIRTANSKALKITANIVGGVTIDKDSTAFAIIGDASDMEKYETDWGATYEFGYEKKGSPSIAGGYALGYINVGNGTNGFAGILGDCSSTSKTLSLNIGSNNIDIVFNEDYTGKTNDYILGIINTALGEYGVASLDSPEKYMFPLFNGVYKGLINNTNTGDIIRKGMGVIITSNNTVRLAKRSDGYIDGVALDDILPYQKGRVITKGKFYMLPDDVTNNFYYNNILHNASEYNNGNTFGIDANSDGVFTLDTEKPIFRIEQGFASLLT